MGKRGLRIGATIGIAVGIYNLAKGVMAAPADQKAARAVLSLTGYNIVSGAFEWKRADFAIPAVAGAGLSMVASKVGLNRYTPKGINI